MFKSKIKVIQRDFDSKYSSFSKCMYGQNGAGSDVW